LLSALTVLAPLAFAQPAAKPAGTAAERVATQNALFEEYYELGLREFPERATSAGDYRYNDRLSDYSLEAVERHHQSDIEFIHRLKAISTEGFADQDLLSHDLLLRVLRMRLDDYELREYLMPINQQNGVHTGLADLPNSVPLDSVKHYEDYIARLHQIPRVLTQATSVLREGMKQNLMPVRFLIEKLPGQCEGIIKADPSCARPRSIRPASARKTSSA
jgi:uncharacterized protein (DUF885 family)